MYNSAASLQALLSLTGAMSNASDEVRKKMADPYTLGGFIPEIDRNGVKDGRAAATVSSETARWFLGAEHVVRDVSCCPTYAGIVGFALGLESGA